MKRYIAGAVVLAVLMAAWALGFQSPASRSSVSPFRTVTRFVDAFDNGDYRQVCAVTYLHEGQTMAQCEQFYVTNGAQGLFFGVWGGYKVVPHSLKAWRQEYRGRVVELATVRFQYRPAKGPWGRQLTAFLVKTRHGVWKVWRVQ